MGMAYACADTVVSRAGSGTVFEILALKKPALFIPLEGQTRGDQAENAEYFLQKGLCRVLRQGELSSLATAIHLLFQDEGLHERLEKTDFHHGNEVILNEICRQLKI
jgi:UDP-N-acetylglucosamine--N-acetylmuramyl-(pentapeptide) pyrophosphoryl-undecaprenol N-acetylglucosamine transferase